MRIERDLLGEIEIPDDAYYGAQTMRALLLFTPSKELINEFPEFIYCMVSIKKACAIVHKNLNYMPVDIADSIIEACNEILSGKFYDQFILDMLSGNDFAAINMNFNEVIACRANELLCGEKGYKYVHPNNHVNMGQSTCDSAIPAVKLALYFELNKVISSVETLAKEYTNLSIIYKNSIKLSHTCFQDAAPTSMGHFFGASASFLNRQITHLKNIQQECLGNAIGFTAIGTGLGSLKGFHEKINSELSNLLKVNTYHVNNPMDELQYADIFIKISSTLKATITGISKMARDIRIMSSGPNGGLNEITIAPVQNGSSFFPGKVNPSLAELVNIAAYQVCGNDMSITMAAEAGELDINPWYPVFAVNNLNSCKLIYNSVNAFAKNCVSTIKVNEKNNLEKANKSPGLASALSNLIGYDEAVNIMQYATEHNLTIHEAAIHFNILNKSLLDEIFDPLVLIDRVKSSNVLTKKFNQ